MGQKVEDEEATTRPSAFLYVVVANFFSPVKSAGEGRVLSLPLRTQVALIFFAYEDRLALTLNAFLPATAYTPRSP